MQTKMKSDELYGKTSISFVRSSPERHFLCPHVQEKQQNKICSEQSINKCNSNTTDFYYFRSNSIAYSMEL